MNRTLRSNFLQEACGYKHKKKKKKEEDLKEGYSVDDAIYAVDKMYDQFDLVKKMINSKKAEAAWKKFIAVVNTEIKQMK